MMAAADALLEPQTLKQLAQIVYLYARPRPAYLGMPGQPAPSEISTWTNLTPGEPAEYQVSKAMQAFFVNFIKTGNPNGPGLPDWPAYRAGNDYQPVCIHVESHAEPEAHRNRGVA